MAAKSQGMSTSKKVIAGAAVGVALPAAVGTAKKLMGSDDESDGGRRSRRRSSTKSRSAAKSRGSSSKSRGKTNSSSSPTREQLYKTAVRLKIAGRSSMSKSQLQRAVSRARSRG